MVGRPRRQFDRLHSEVEVERVTHEVAHVAGDALPLERADDEIFADTVDLATILVELRVRAAGAELVEIDVARVGAHGGAIDTVGGALRFQPDLVDRSRRLDRGAQRPVAGVEQIEGHLLGEALGVARTEDMRRVAQENSKHPVWVLITVLNERVLDPGGCRGLLHRVDDGRSGDGARPRDAVVARGACIRHRISLCVHARDAVAFEAGLAVEPVDPHPGQLAERGHGPVQSRLQPLRLTRTEGALAVPVFGGEALGEQVATDLHHLAEADLAGADLVLVEADGSEQRRPVGIGKAEGRVTVVGRRGGRGTGLGGRCSVVCGGVGAVRTRRRLGCGGVGAVRARRRLGRGRFGSGFFGHRRFGRGRAVVSGGRGLGGLVRPAQQDRVDVAFHLRARRGREAASHDERHGGNG